MATLKGVDVSRYQGDIDFAKLKKSVDFVIMQAGYGKYASQTDQCFERNYAGCKKHGIPCGAYWYSYAKTAEEAKLEAKACMEVIKGKQFEYPIYLDVEGESLTDRNSVSKMCSAFCDALENAGYFAGIYMSRSPAQTYLDSATAKRYALWLAEYGSKLNYSGTYGMWQYSSTGKVNGISGNADCDYCYEDYPKLIKEGGFNGYKKTSADKELDTEGLKLGDKSDGVLAYKCLLRIADKKGILSVSVDDTGGFGGGTENATNALLKKLGYKENGIAGSKLIKKLYEEIVKAL